MAYDCEYQKKMAGLIHQIQTYMYLTVPWF